MVRPFFRFWRSPYHYSLIQNKMEYLSCFPAAMDPYQAHLALIQMQELGWREAFVIFAYYLL